MWIRLYLPPGGPSFDDYGVVAVDFNGVRVSGTSLIYYSDYVLRVLPPAGITPGKVSVVTTNLGNSNGLTYRFPTPQPVSGAEISGTQYVTMGSIPAPIIGRIVANGSTRDYTGNADLGALPYPIDFPVVDNNIALTEYIYFLATGYFKVPLFADIDQEKEAVQWQLSYDNSNWSDINGATQKDYQPDACYRTTYYRRRSTHLEHRCCGLPSHREDWYDSNIVTITPYQPVADGTYTLYNRNSGQVLEIGGASLVPGKTANQWPSTGTASQQWTLTTSTPGLHKITNRNSGQALEIGGSSTLTPGALANQWGYWQGQNQQWQLIPVDSAPNYVRIFNVNSGQVLEIGGGSTQAGAGANQYTASAGDFNYAQQWQLVSVKAPVASQRFTGVYSIRNVASGKLLEVSNAGLGNGDVVQQGADAGVASQQWVFEDAGGGLFNIKNRNSNKSLDVYMGGLNNGDLVQQYGYGGGNNQKWEVFEVRPGVFRITSYHTIVAANPKSLDIDLNRIKNDGVQVQQWQYGGGSNQEWNISYVSNTRVAAPTKDIPSQQAAQPGVMANSTLSLYPNPASTVLTVALSNATPTVALTIRDLRGAVVMARQEPNNGQVDISALTSSTYFVTVNDGAQEYHQKFTKE